MIFCVIPRELEDELYDKMLYSHHDSDNEEKPVPQSDVSMDEESPLL